MPDLISTYAELLERVVSAIKASSAPFLVAIAGPPATGKSTLADRLVTDLNASGIEACFCPMDGFHLTNAQLEANGLRDAKGRIDTFDASAFAAAVERLKERTSFWWPIYSRQRHDPIPEGTRISGHETACVIEGNYLLSDTQPWHEAAKAYDLRVFVDAPDAVLHKRLAERHKQSGRAAQEALDKIERTDMPNATAIRDQRQNEDILFCEHAYD
jgi:pantothenate kinase